MKHYSWLLLLFIHTGLLAQQPLYSNFQKFDVDNGLPQNLVTGITQDADGFIWVNTKDGLARYDGKEFLTFRHQPGDSNSLSSNTTDGLFKDSQNNLWVLNGKDDFNKIDPRTFKITRSKKILIPQGKGMSKNPQQNGEYNLKLDQKLQMELLDPLKERLRTFLGKKSDFGGNNICAFSEDSNAKLWLLTGQGLEISDDRWENFKSIVFPPEFQFNFERITFIPKLFHLRDGRIAVLEGDKILLYNSANENVKAVTVPQPFLGKINFSSTTKDVQGRLVFEYQNHIFRLNDDDSITLLWTNKEIFAIRCIFIDRTNTLWVGTDPNGLYKINLLTPAFESHTYRHDFITDVLVDQVGIPPKVIRRDTVDRLNAYLSRYAYPEKGTLVLYYQTVIQGPFDHVVTKIKNRSLEFVYRGKENNVISLSPDRKIWALDESGFMRQWSDFSKPPFLNKIEVPARTPVINDNSSSPISDILIDDNSYWVSTKENGIHQFKNDKLIRTIQPHGNYYTNVLSHDPTQKNILWIGTITGGLYKWDKVNNKLLATYTTENGLPNNTINSLVLDSLGYMWISTNKGITRFNPAKETFTNYTVADGLVESEFNRHHDLLLPDGRIAMGGTKGYSVFYPGNFSDDTYAPEVFITKVSVNEKLVEHRIDTTILSAPVNQLEQLDLSYANNTIAFEIAAMQFNAPEKIKYRYRLEGYDKNWVSTEADRPIRFAQLPTGDYTLLLNASNTNGVWSSSVRKLALVVHPPFWLTWWAYSFYIMVIALVVRAYWRGYRMKLIAKQEAAFNVREAVRLRELDETKTRFFSNITHEFRTPLTLILSPLEKHLQDASLPPKALTLLNNNYRHANQLLKLVNQLLDISKLEAGQMRMNPTTGEFDMFVEQCVSSFQAQANEKSIALTLSNSNVSGNYLFDHEKWEKILFNLLSNAIKFTPTGGTVAVSISSERNNPNHPARIKIQVHDSGVGMKEEELTKIFERFYQVDDSATRKHEGTGIGLSLVKELINLMGGVIHVTSTIDRGTLFTIEIAIEKLKEIPPAREVSSINNFHITDEETVPGVDHDLPVILVVDDNEELRSFVKESLSVNWKVLEASNGFDGWTIIENELPEIVISDVMMPGMSGFELCAKAKKDLRTSHINFIMLTAKAAQESKIEGLESGADEYITKPFHLYELELRIRNLLQEQNSLRKHLQEKLLPEKPVLELQHVSDLFLTKLQTYLDNHLDNSKLNVETLSEAMAMSKSTLNRKLKALLNISVNDFLKKYRLQKSVLLLNEGHSVSEVAYRVGFESSSYFTQCFKEQFKQTPSEFSHARV